jgi:glycosyltransferase involved in cell wall biosynthesis
VEGSTGEAAPLVLLGVEPAAERAILVQASALGVENTVRILPPVPLDELPELFRGAAAYLSADPEADGQPLRWALSCGVPVAGLSLPEPVAILGQAGYLVQPGNARRLGAACLTLLVEEQVAAGLRDKGLARAEAYRGRGPLEAWLRVFRATAS